MKQSIVKVDIEDMKQEALKHLKTHYCHSQGNAGRHQFLGSEQIGSIATAQILLSFDNFMEDFSEKQRMEASLLKCQISGSGNFKTEGGWSHITNHQGIATTEATCMALLALKEGNASHPKVQAGLTWLIRNARMQNDEGWGITPGDISRVYTTCLALKTLKEFGEDNTPEYRKGLSWLLNAQNEDEGWGSTVGAVSNLTYTSHVIITLIGIGFDCNNESLKLAIQWLKKNTRGLPEKKARVYYEYDECIEFTNGKINFHHLPVQAAITALVLSGDAKSYTVFARVNELMANCNSYYWSKRSINEGERKPLWAIFETMQLCKMLEETNNSWSSLKVIHSKGKRLSYADRLHQFDFKRFKRHIIQGEWGYIIHAFPKWGVINFLPRAFFPFLIELLGNYINLAGKIKRGQKA